LLNGKINAKMKIATRAEIEIMLQEEWVFKFHLINLSNGMVWGLLFNPNYCCWVVGADACKLLKRKTPSYPLLKSTKRGCLDFANKMGYVLQTKKQRRAKDLRAVCDYNNNIHPLYEIFPTTHRPHHLACYIRISASGIPCI
jgi:hypothetical protein